MLFLTRVYEMECVWPQTHHAVTDTNHTWANACALTRGLNSEEEPENAAKMQTTSQPRIDVEKKSRFQVRAAQHELGRSAEWCVCAARAWAIDCCSCRQAARSRRPLRRGAALLEGCQPRSIVKGDTNKKKGHAWDRRLLLLLVTQIKNVQTWRRGPALTQGINPPQS